jgi:hypothetical protein
MHHIVSPLTHNTFKCPRFDKNDFDIRRTLGVGAFGFVKLVQWKLGPPGSENTFYALKCVSKEKIIKHKQQEKIKSEENIMKSMVHPFIARCYSVMEDDLGKYFLMEALCGGELCELLYHETQFSEKWSMFYSASVLTAFGHMHQHKIAYRGKLLFHVHNIDLRTCMIENVLPHLVVLMYRVAVRTSLSFTDALLISCPLFVSKNDDAQQI